MQRTVFLFLTMVFVCLYCAVTAILAAPLKADKFKHADKNRDGVIDAKELKLEKSWESSRIARHGKAKVNTPLEAKYDADADGWLEDSEAREMLKDRYEPVKTGGKAKVDSAIEQAYDVNNDGVLDADEAERMKEEIQ